MDTQPHPCSPVERHGQVFRVADTDASEGVAITKGLLKKKKKCERDVVVGRDAGSMLQPLLAAVLILAFPPFPLYKGLGSLYKEKQSPGKNVYSILLNFGGGGKRKKKAGLRDREEGAGHKREGEGEKEGRHA